MIIIKKLKVFKVIVDIFCKKLVFSFHLFICFISDCLRTIRDPEKPATLEDLNVIYEDGIFVMPPTKSNVSVVSLISIEIFKWLKTEI